MEADGMMAKSEAFVPIRLKRRQSQLVDTGLTVRDPGLLASIGRALYWQSLPDSGAEESFAELAAREGLAKPSDSHVLRLALLAPDSWNAAWPASSRAR